MVETLKPGSRCHGRSPRAVSALGRWGRERSRGHLSLLSSLTLCRSALQGSVALFTVIGMVSPHLIHAQYRLSGHTDRVTVTTSPELAWKHFSDCASVPLSNSNHSIAIEAERWWPYDGDAVILAPQDGAVFYTNDLGVAPGMLVLTSCTVAACSRGTLNLTLSQHFLTETSDRNTGVKIMEHGWKTLGTVMVGVTGSLLLRCLVDAKYAISIVDAEGDILDSVSFQVSHPKLLPARTQKFMAACMPTMHAMRAMHDHQSVGAKVCHCSRWPSVTTQPWLW